jgi:hypothetical protein
LQEALKLGEDFSCAEEARATLAKLE